MLAASLQVEDQFYTPVKAKRSKKFFQKHQRQNKDVISSEERDASKSKLGSPVECIGQYNSSSNLSKFVESTTPSVLALYFSKTTIRGWRTCDVEYLHYFKLEDLWDSFKEWSAYGAGVPLVIDGCDNGVIQYYVPYLSAIQLYGESSGTNANSREAGKDRDGDDYRVSGSDGSTEYVIEEGMNFSWLLQGTHSGMIKGSLPSLDKHSETLEGSSSDDSEAGNIRPQLLYEFLEHETPHCREPLADKVADLASSYPGLKTLRSCDILPVSWISVAWYPIYRIPTGPTLRDLDACFLTYHYLSSPLKGHHSLPSGSGSSQNPMLVYPNEIGGIPKFFLPAFGLASYKFKGAMWTQNGSSECPVANCLMKEADNWLKLLQVNHPDFQFFVSRGSYER
ncbi:hypothetical protein Nepgr_002928 [Nepenthes gracilis]|uniref:Uncharacterized protein n=1 Tax=Nepenthes gracilis TaxID=150966 RepID=A0AAD3PA69_NEPGR|nr:hypothetical protein Nepgr_002928 [Nepenthes gracilis]